MKKLLVIILTISMLSTLMVGCTKNGQPAANQSKSSSTAAPAAKLKVGIIVPTNNEWNQIYFEGAKATAEELGMEMTIFDAQNDVQQQINFVNSCVSQKFDAVTIQPIDTAALAPAMKKAAEAGVIVVSHYDVDPKLGINDVIYQLLFGQKESGVMEAEQYIKMNGEEGEVGIIAGLAGADNTRLRSEGIREVLKKYPKIKIVSEINCSWDRQVAMATAEDMITSYPNLKAFISMDDNMSFGVYEAIKSAGKTDKIKVATQGFYKDSVQAIKDGKFMFSISYPPSAFSIGALKMIKNIKDGKPQDKKVVLGMELVDLKNVDTAKY